MTGIKLQKREADFFVSYGHGDLARVKPVVDLLKRVCGLRIWFDGADGNASLRSSELLGNAIGNARGSLFFVSEAWRHSSWCKNEFEVSLKEQRAHDGFEIISLRLDDVVPPDWFEVAEIIDLSQPDRTAIARLLRSLGSDVPRRFDNAEDVYLAAPWNRPSDLAREAFAALDKTGWRLVGDAPNLKHLGKRRVDAIQRTTRGFVAVMPHDSLSDTSTSPYIVQEARGALELGKPVLLLTEPGVHLPQDLVHGSFLGNTFELTSGRAALDDVLADFDTVLEHVPHDDTGAFIFFAGSLRGDPAEAEDIASVIERSSNMRCVRGERLSGENVQTAIIDLIRRAAVVIGDVSDDHRNTLIESGIAMGSGTPLKLICRKPANGVPLKKRFMLEGHEFYWYQTSEERLALCYYFARQFRRRVYFVR